MTSSISGKITSLPILIIYPVSDCDCRCTMCGYWQKGNNSRLSKKNIQDLLPEIAELGIRQVVISGGEPLLHPELPEILSIIKSLNIPITLLTNGLKLAEKTFRIAGLLEELIVSLDGPESVHDSVRGVKQAYIRLKRGVDTTRKIRPDLKIIARSTIQKANFLCLRQIIDVAKELKVNAVSFLAVNADRDAFQRESVHFHELTNNLLLDQHDIPVLKAELEKLFEENKADFQAGFIVESPEKLLQKIYGYFSARAGLLEFSPVFCNASSFSAVITSNGDVKLCFFSTPVGNIFADKGLKKVLNSEPARGMRINLNNQNLRICRECVCSLHYRV